MVVAVVVVWYYSTYILLYYYNYYYAIVLANQVHSLYIHAHIYACPAWCYTTLELRVNSVRVDSSALSFWIQEQHYNISSWCAWQYIQALSKKITKILAISIHSEFEEISFIIVSISFTVLGTWVNSSTPSHVTTMVSSTFACTHTNYSTHITYAPNVMAK